MGSTYLLGFLNLCRLDSPDLPSIIEKRNCTLFRYVYNFSYGSDGSLGLDIEMIQGKGKNRKSKKTEEAKQHKGKVTVEQVDQANRLDQL